MSPAAARTPRSRRPSRRWPRSTPKRSRCAPSPGTSSSAISEIEVSAGKSMRVVVLGVGGVGAMAAWRLAAAGCDVIALEQYRIDHDRGSSFGDSRIVRRVYPDQVYTRMMAGAYALWSRLME